MDPPSQPGRIFTAVLTLSIAFMLVAMLLSCENDMAKVNELTMRDTLPIVSSTNVNIHYTENGRPKLNLKAPQADLFVGNEPYQEFPSGFVVIFYDSLMNPKAELKADYGINYENTKIMEAERNVQVINFEKNEKINTEHLIWDQKRKIIFSGVFVKITTRNDVIYGENGFESDESFNNWVIKKPSGEIVVEKGL